MRLRTPRQRTRQQSKETPLIPAAMMVEMDTLHDARRQWAAFEEGDSTELKLEKMDLNKETLQFLGTRTLFAGDGNVTGKFWQTDQRPFRLVLDNVTIQRGAETYLKDLFQGLDRLYRLTFSCSETRPIQRCAVQDGIERGLSALAESDMELGGIHIRGVVISPEMGPKLGQMSCRVEKLAFSRCAFTAESMEMFAKSTSGSPRKFWFHRCGLNDTTLATFVDHCGFEGNCIRELDLSLNNLTQGSFSSIGRLIRSHQNSLRHLYVGGNLKLFSSPNLGPLKTFLDALKVQTAFRTLNLRKARIRHGAAELLRSLPDCCKKLALRETMLFSSSTGRGEIMEELGTILRKGRLEKLDLINCCLSNQLVSVIFKTLETNRSVRILDLKHNRFQASGWEDSLPSCTITKLSLPSSVCTETAWPQLESVLRRNTSLQVVEFNAADSAWSNSAKQITTRNTCLAKSSGIYELVPLFPCVMEKLSTGKGDADALFLFLKEIVGPLSQEL